MLKEKNRIIIFTYLIGIILNYTVTLLIGLPYVGILVNSIKMTSILTAWWLFYFYYGWRMPYLRKIIFRMDFNGTWFGKYDSISINSEKYSGDIALRINQNYLMISVISFTEKYQNFSYSELVKFNEKSNIYGLNYTYSQKENNLFDIAQRNGTAELTLKNTEEEPILEGHFWTIHGTQGKIRVKRISRRQIDTFDEAIKNAKAAK